MAVKFVQQQRDAVTVRAISGHPTGVTLPAAQAEAVRLDPSSATGRALASGQPNTDRRRFVTH